MRVSYQRIFRYQDMMERPEHNVSNTVPRTKGVTALARTKSLSKQIRDARTGKGFTVAELANKLGVSQVSVYYWESGRVRPRDTNLTALCKALKMPIRETMALTGR